MINSVTKQCSLCLENKPLESFCKKWDTKDGLNMRCRSCKVIESKKWRVKNPNSVRNSNLKYFTGLSLYEYNLLFEFQKGCCAICGRHQSELNKSLFVDHNHETGKIRGLLCSKCNFGIGIFKDDVKLLRNGIEYLNHYKN